MTDNPAHALFWRDTILETPMRLLDWLNGWKSPAADVPVRSVHDLGAALLAVNRATAPFRVRRGDAGEPDFIAEWRIAETRWHPIFANSGIERTSRILLRLDGDQHEVCAANEGWSVEWRAGVPVLRPGTRFIADRVAVQFGTDYAFTEQLSYGVDRHYRFSARELKAPVQAVVASCGWTWRAVALSAV